MSRSNATERRGALWRRLAILFVVSVLVNYLWEMAQTPLYKGMDDFSIVWWHCGLAAMGVHLIFLDAAGYLSLQSKSYLHRLSPVPTNP